MILEKVNFKEAFKIYIPTIGFNNPTVLSILSKSMTCNDSSRKNSFLDDNLTLKAILVKMVNFFEHIFVVKSFQNEFLYFQKSRITSVSEIFFVKCNLQIPSGIFATSW